MYKIAASVSAVTMIVAASYFKTTETAGLFAIAWIGGVTFAAALILSKSYFGRE